MLNRIVASIVVVGSLALPVGAAGQSQRSMARTLTGVGVMAGGVVVALTGTDCRVNGEFDTFSTTTFLGSVNLTGKAPILSDTCALTDFTISGNVGFDTINRPASEYNVNLTQLDIKKHIEADVHGEQFRKAGNLYGGVAMIGVGALLAIVWSDAPSVGLSLEPGGARLSKTFGF